MSDLTVFEFGSKKVRTAGTSEEPLFCAADVCAVLGISNASDALSRLRDQERTTIGNTDIGKNTAKKGSPPKPPMVYVTEPGLFKLIFTSRKEEAERFQDWVTSEVLPAIRRRGAYSIVEASERRRIVDVCFRALPAKQATLFDPLIDELRKFARHSDGGSGGTPPWARLIACWIYEWTWKQHKGEIRKRNPVNDEGSLVWRDYETLSDEGRRLVSITIGMAVFAARESHSWADWRQRMEAYFKGSEYQNWLPFSAPSKQLAPKSKAKSKGQDSHP